MEYRTLGRTSTRISRLGLGTAGFASLEATDPRELDAMVGSYLDAGGTVFDTASSYDAGLCEETLGRVLRGGRRDRALVLDKVGWPFGGRPGGLGRSAVLGSLDESLQRLGTDHIDVYQLHFFDDRTPLAETLEALDECVRSGKVRHVGASAFFAWQLALANGLTFADARARLESVQLAYNLVQRDAEREHLPYCVADDVTVVVYSPLHGGVLSDDWAAGRAVRLTDPLLSEIYLAAGAERARTVGEAVHRVAQRHGRAAAEVSLGWLFAQPAVGCVLVGPTTRAELELDLRALQQPFPATDLAELGAESAVDLGYPASFYHRKERMWARMAAQGEDHP